MKVYGKLCICFFVILCFFSPGSIRAQESVDVPQLLQKDVYMFKLTIDSLENLASSIRSHTEDVMDQLRIIRQKMQLLPKNSRAFRLQHKHYEDALSGYWARKYVMLQDMHDLRERTLSSLENVLGQLQSGDEQSNNVLLQHVREEIRQTEDQLSQTKLQMLHILETLKQPDIPFDKKRRLTRKFQLLQNENLALYEAHRKRLRDLQQLASQPNSELPATYEALLTIRDDLQSRYLWVDTEMAYLNLYADYRKDWLAIDARLVEVSGLVERFSDMVAKINANRYLMQQVEDFEKQLRPMPDTSSFLMELPALEWPGKSNKQVEIRDITPAEIDSLQRALENELKSTTSN